MATTTTTTTTDDDRARFIRAMAAGWRDQCEISRPTNHDETNHDETNQAEET